MISSILSPPCIGAVATTVTQSITSPVTTATVTNTSNSGIMKQEIKNDQQQQQQQMPPQQQGQGQGQQPLPQGQLQPQQVQLVKVGILNHMCLVVYDDEAKGHHGRFVGSLALQHPCPNNLYSRTCVCGLS